MRSKNKILYFNITLFVLASLFAIDTFSIRGHNLIRNVLAVTDKITGEGTVNYLTRFAGGANPSNQIGDSIIYDDGGGPVNGKIGIGTTAPGEKLDVAGSIRANGAIYSMTPGGYGQTVLYQWGLGSSGTIYIEPAAGNHLYLTDSWSGTGTLQSRFAYAEFRNGSGSAYTPIYASDYYSSAAGGVWMSQLCRSNGTNCPAAGNLSGSGTTNYLPIFTGASSLGNSTISDNGSYYTINSRSLYVPSGWVIASDLRSRSGYIYAGGSDWEVIRGNDSWLRLNQGGQFASGVYTPGYLRVDGGVGVVGGNLTVDAGYVYAYNNSYPIRLGELWGHTGLYNGSSSQIMYFASDQYFNFLNRSGNYGPGVYAADFYSNTAGVWMSQLCRSNGTNCPAAGDFVPKNTWWGSTYTGSDGNIYLGFWGKWLSTDLSERATHRAEGTNFVDYSRYVYNNGAYSGSGWMEPSELGVRYAYTSYAADNSYKMYDAYVGGFHYSNDLTVSWAVWAINAQWANTAGNANTLGGQGPSAYRQFNVWQNGHYSGTDGNEYNSASMLVGTYLNIGLYTGDSPGSAMCKRSYDNYVGLCGSLTIWKENISDLGIGLETLMKLRPVEYDWKHPEGTVATPRDLGFLAEEAIAVDPLLGSYDNGKLIGVRYDHITALLTKAIQELNIRTQDLSASVTETLLSLGAKFENGILFVTRLVTDKLTVGELKIKTSATNPIIGSGIVRAGASRVFIQNTTVEKNAKIFITFRGNAGDWWVSETKDDGFTVSLAKSTPQDIVFDYWIVLVE